MSAAPSREAPTPRVHRVEIVEVGPRDGLQNQPEALSVDAKAQFIASLAAAGLRRIEAAAFVHPKKVPQMADAEAVWARVAAVAGASCRLSALVPNRKGLDRALEAGVTEIAVVASATDTFNMRNLDATVEETLGEIEAMGVRAQSAGIPVRAYLSVAFVCPYEGPVAPDRVVSVTRRLLEAGAAEVAISDTIGAATPGHVARVLSRVLTAAPAERLALHFHDTRGTALPNVLEALGLGIRTFDASAGGLGGCPFAPGALGNVATEDLLYMLDGMGVETGVSLEGVMAASRELEAALGRSLPSRVLRAGGRPRATRPGA